ncbi:hypothetical protein QBC36DRAFT_331818 [Triangularia setosa]|uniref:Uncharacterized protein n=1 Tax=Triangularia setosa TaxID=2587417 RepID=A0AAN6W5C5_9PEZI|nr:hypothetical protein QBC36DRAFT_331818 [Podospora setosa]
MMGLTNDKSRVPKQPNYRDLTANWECEVDNHGGERWIRQLVQWRVQSVLGENRFWLRFLCMGQCPVKRRNDPFRNQD